MPKAFEERHHGARPVPEIARNDGIRGPGSPRGAKRHTHNCNGYLRQSHTKRTFEDTGDEKRNDDRCDSAPFQRFEH